MKTQKMTATMSDKAAAKAFTLAAQDLAGKAMNQLSGSRPDYAAGLLEGAAMLATVAGFVASGDHVVGWRYYMARETAVRDAMPKALHEWLAARVTKA